MSGISFQQTEDYDMKRCSALLLAAILLLTLFPFPKAEAEEGTNVRVLLGTGGAEKIDVAVKGTYSVGDTTFTGGTLTASINNGTITVAHSEKNTLAASKTSVRVEHTERSACFNRI